MAQSHKQDVLYLKNGGIIYGAIKERTDKVKIQISGGSMLVYKVDEVDSIKQEKANKAILHDFNTNYYRHDRGYRNITELQFVYGPTPLKVQSWEYYTQSGDDVGLSIHTINGYQIWPYLFIGAGVGADRMLTYRQTFIPLYLRVSSELLKKRVTPYLFADMGYAFMVADDVSYTGGYKYYHRGGGLYVTAGGGLRVYTRSRASIMIGAGYKRTYSEVKYAYQYYDSPDYLIRRTYQRLVVTFGVTF